MARKKKTAESDQPASSSSTGAPRKTAGKKNVSTGASSKRTSAKRKKAPDDSLPSNPGPADFPVVGLGASAGGLEALEEFFESMSADSGMAFVVIMHQAAKHVSMLPEILDKCTAMDVAPIHDRTRVEQNRVYTVPPGKCVDLLIGTLHLSNLPERHVAPLPIDYFFRSLAAEQREMAVAIVLSGTGTDGTLGLSAIKGESGMVMVQSVASAKFSGMPQHAIEAGWADYVLSPKEMPEQLIKYARGPFLKAAPAATEKPAPAIEQALPGILLALRRRCGHDFSGYKTSTVCRRIERRLNLHAIDTPDSYLKYLDQHPPEANSLFRDLLIGVTSFFRDPWAFEALARKAILPMLKEKSNDSEFRVWVPGCSTGEETYTIAILIRECLDELKLHLNVQIFATDLDDQAIELARVGLFPDGIRADVSPTRLEQFFTKEDSHYRIRKELRDWLVFAPQNIIHDPPFTKLDLISCRNLLIYMQSSLQKKLLTLFHYSLRSDGCLFMGTSESISGFDDLFEVLDAKAKVFCRKESQRRFDHEVQFPVAGGKMDEPDKRAVAPKEMTAVNIRDAITKMLATEFAPPTVVVSESGEIIHVHGRTGKFLELAPGGPPGNIASMAREGLELDLSSALRKAARQDAQVIRENVPVKTNGSSVLINLIVKKVVEPKSLRGLLRVSFQVIANSTPPVAEATLAKEKPDDPTDAHASYLKEIQNELQHTRESLQRTIEDLDASNEEMKSANEELQSTNEELQSTNEELETSKEEMQSLNEELQTVNAEYQDKIHELSTANDDMNNLLNSTDIATIFLDNGMKIKRYTERAKHIVRLIPTDLGRSLGDLASHLRYDGLVSDVEEVLKTLIPRQTEVQTDDGHWLLMRILPYRTSDNRIDGLVMTFVDINETKRMLDETTAFMRDIVATIRQPLLVLDDKMQVLFVNNAFVTLFSVAAGETTGKLVYDLGDGEWNIPALRDLLEDVLPGKRSFDDFEVIHDFPVIGRKRMLLNARRIKTASAGPNMILLAIEEMGL